MGVRAQDIKMYTTHTHTVFRLLGSLPQSLSMCLRRQDDLQDPVALGIPVSLYLAPSAGMLIVGK